MIGRSLRHCALAICILSAFITVNLAIKINASSPDSNISLLWSFAAITGPEDQRTLIALESDSILYSGDKFKMMFQAEQQCYIYIIFAGTDGEILMLHPQELESPNKPAEPSKRVYIPAARDWFMLDQKSGTETLYLLVSSSPLADLESQLKRYDSASLEEKEEIAQAIAKLIETHEMLSQPLTAAAEKPLLIGGTIRSLTERPVTKEDISKFAEKIAVDDIFVRTYSIDHR
jgi:hypothetical protein